MSDIPPEKIKSFSFCNKIVWEIEKMFYMTYNIKYIVNYRYESDAGCNGKTLDKM